MQIVAGSAHRGELLRRGCDSVLLLVDRLKGHEVCAVGHGEVAGEAEVCHLVFVFCWERKGFSS